MAAAPTLGQPWSTTAWPTLTSPMGLDVAEQAWRRQMTASGRNSGCVITGSHRPEWVATLHASLVGLRAAKTARQSHDAEQRSCAEEFNTCDRKLELHNEKCAMVLDANLVFGFGVRGMGQRMNTLPTKRARHSVASGLMANTGF